MTNTKTTPRRFNGTIECWGAELPPVSWRVGLGGSGLFVVVGAGHVVGGM